MGSQAVACVGCEHIAVIRSRDHISDILPGIERNNRNAHFLSTENHVACHSDTLYFTFCFSCERQRGLDYDLDFITGAGIGPQLELHSRLTNINLARAFLDHWPLLQKLHDISVPAKLSATDTLPRPVLKIEFLSDIIRTRDLEVRDVIRWEGDRVFQDNQANRPFFTTPE